MGGGKTETYSELAAEPMFALDDNLYAKELVRLFAIYKKVIPTVFTAAMIDGSRQYFNPAVFEAMGVAVKNDAAVTSITIGGVDSYISTTYGTSVHAVYYYSSTDTNGDPINIPAHKTKDHLDKTYTSSTDYLSSYIESATMNIQSQPIYNRPVGCAETTGDQVYQLVHGDAGPDSVNIETSIPSYEINSGEWYYVTDPVPDVDGNIKMEGLDTTVTPWIPNGILLDLAVPEDLRTVYISRYAYNTDPCSSWTDAPAFSLFKDDIVGEVSTYRFFIFPVKNHGDFIDNTDYQNVLLNDLGLGNGVLNDSLSDPRIEKSILSYSTDYNSATFHDIITTVYGEFGNSNEVVFNTPNYNITYASTSSATSMINFDGNSFIIGDKGLYILPVIYSMR